MRRGSRRSRRDSGAGCDYARPLWDSHARRPSDRVAGPAATTYQGTVISVLLLRVHCENGLRDDKPIGSSEREASQTEDPRELSEPKRPPSFGVQSRLHARRRREREGSVTKDKPLSREEPRCDEDTKTCSVGRGPQSQEGRHITGNFGPPHNPRALYYDSF